MELSPIRQILESFRPLSLVDIEKVKLMNRTDTKFVMNSSKIAGLLDEMKNNYFILEINGMRELSYSTSYLDTEDFRYYHRHVTGREVRNKVRFRKYLATGESFLEIKHRNNKGRTVKKRIEVNPENFGLLDKSGFIFLESVIPGDAGLLKCMLSTGFTRITLAGESPAERVTIDYDIVFSKPGGAAVPLPGIAIAELKRDSAAGTSPVLLAMKKPGVYRTGFSKYCVGTSLLYDNIRHNSIKPSLLLLNKIKNDYSIDLCA